MSEGLQITADEIRRALDEEELRDWVQQQRWYASKARQVAGIEIVESILLRDDPLLLLALVQTRFATGTHELYQLPLALQAPGADGLPHGESIAHTEDWTVYDALAEPTQALELLRRIETTDEIPTADGQFSFHRVEGAEPQLSADTTVRLIGVEQSNSSIVFDDSIVLKVFRKLEPGINPELEMLRFLTGRGFPNIAPLHGWYEYEGQALASTLGVAQTFLPDAVDGWELALDEIGPRPRCSSSGSGASARSPRSCTRAGLRRVRSGILARGAEPGGAVAADRDDRRGHRADLPAPARRRAPRADRRPRPGRSRAARRPRPDRRQRPRDPHPRRLPPRTDAVHAARLGDHRLRGRAGASAARAPAEALAAARRREHAALVRVRDLGGRAPASRRAPADFEQRARERFLEHYFADVDPTLLPAGEAAITNLLSIFELEKAIYELQYELDNRPDWVSIPVAGIGRLLEGA